MIPSTKGVFEAKTSVPVAEPNQTLLYGNPPPSKLVVTSKSFNVYIFPQKD